MGLLSWLSGKKSESHPPQPAEPEEPGLAPGVPVEDLSEALSSAEGALRVDAARALLERWRAGDGGAAGVLAPRLSELLEDPEPMVRVAALAAVRQLRKPENLERCRSAVLASLADRSAPVRTAAVWSALRLPGDAAREQVRAVLESTDEGFRFAAACALAEVRDAAALPELCRAAEEEHRRQEAVSALMALADPGALPVLHRLFEDEGLGQFDRTLVAAALARFGDPRGGAHLVARIEAAEDDAPIAAEWAGRVRVAEAAAALADAAEADGDPTQGAALRALGRLGAPGAEEMLLRIAGSDECPEDLRMDAAEGLAELATPAALDRLRAIAAGGEGELSRLCQDLLVEVAATGTVQGEQARSELDPS